MNNVRIIIRDVANLLRYSKLAKPIVAILQAAIVATHALDILEKYKEKKKENNKEPYRSYSKTADSLAPEILEET